MDDSNSARELFEVARAYRAVYGLRGAYDSRPVQTVSGAIAYSELRLRVERIQMTADATASSSRSGSAPNPTERY